MCVPLRRIKRGGADANVPRVSFVRRHDAAYGKGEYRCANAEIAA
ncbi:MAG: hypothetical protein ABJL67_21045 [Sulfitobacter sp.]